MERTRLAWRRTTLAATVVPLLGVGRVIAAGAPPIAVAAIALVALAWLAIVAVAHQRIRVLTSPSTPDGTEGSEHPQTVRPAAHRAPATLALLTAALALAGTLLLH